MNTDKVSSPPGSRTEPASTVLQLFNKWEAKGRIPVPTTKGHILDLLLIELDRKVEGVDAMVRARSTHKSPLKTFGVVIDIKRPKKQSIPILWLADVDSIGEWV